MELGGSPDGTVIVRAKIKQEKGDCEAMDIDDLIFQDGYEVVISEK